MKSIATDGSASKLENNPKEKIKDTQFKLAIAYNNGAIEYEFIGKIQLALNYFENAI